MADFDDTDFNTDDTNDNSEIREFRAAKKAAAQATRDAEVAQKELQDARREAAFLRAGIDPDSTEGKRIARVHDGEWTAEAIKATGIEFGWVTPPAPVVPAEELAAHDRFAAANNGTVDGITANDEFMSTVAKARTDWRNSDAGKAVVLDQLRKLGIEVDDNEPRPWTAKNGKFDRGALDQLGTSQMFG